MIKKSHKLRTLQGLLTQLHDQTVAIRDLWLPQCVHLVVSLRINPPYNIHVEITRGMGGSN